MTKTKKKAAKAPKKNSAFSAASKATSDKHTEGPYEFSYPEMLDFSREVLDVFKKYGYETNRKVLDNILKTALKKPTKK